MMEHPIFSDSPAQRLRGVLRDYPEARVMQVSAETARSMVPHWPQIAAWLKQSGAKLLVA